MNENIGMSKMTKATMAARLTHLMGVTPSLDTLEKVKARSGVSYGTVRRIKNAEATDVQLGNVEAVAKCFGLSLIEFVSPFDEATELSPAEREIIKDLRTIRSISPGDADDLVKPIAKMAQLHKAASRLRQLPDSDQSETG